MGKEQESERQGASGEGLFICVERWWGRLPIAVRILSIPILFIGLVVAWFYISPDFAQFLGYVVGGVFLLWQISISSQRAKAAEETAKAMQKTVELTEKGNIAERFKNAIEHLGHDSTSIRLGGIYALHQIAQEVEEYRGRVFEILCAHIRGTSTLEGYKPKLGPYSDIEPSIEIESILKLLFSSRDMAGRSLYSGLLANFKDADLSGTKLNFADLRASILWGTNLEGAFLPRANLEKAFLRSADLRGACLQSANLSGARLGGADLQGADLRGAKNLKPEQLLEVKTLYEAKLPDGMEEIIRQQKPKLFDKPKDEQET